MRIEKVELASYVTELIGASDYLFLVSFKGLTVAAFDELRGRISECGAGCHVLKNSFILRGLKGNDLPAPKLDGDTAVVFGTGDPCSAAQVLKKFGREHDAVRFKGGVLDGAVIDAADALAVADLPPLEVVQAQLLGLLLAPASGLVRVLNAKAASIVYVIKAYADKLAEDAQ